MRKALFIDRDGTLIKEPPITFQVDTLEQLVLLPGVIRNLYKISTALNYDLVMVTNQDGLGTPSYPEENFQNVQTKLLQLLSNEDIHFHSIHVDRSFAHEQLATRKPGTGMLTQYLDGSYDLEHSYVIGDRITDVQLAQNLGAGCIFLSNFEQPIGWGSKIDLLAHHWDDIYNFLHKKDRSVFFQRKTSETEISIRLNLDGTGRYDVHTGLSFLDHMLEQLSRHSAIDLSLFAKGDLHIDEHHTIEDTAIALGEAFKLALGKKAGIERYGFCLPMDDCIAQVAIDFGGRSWIEWNAAFAREYIGDVPTEMFFHFFKSFSDAARCNLHIQASGTNEHHKIESIFKAFARAIKMGIKRNDHNTQLPSTKGIL